MAATSKTRTDQRMVTAPASRRTLLAAALTVALALTAAGCGLGEGRPPGALGTSTTSTTVYVEPTVAEAEPIAPGSPAEADLSAFCTEMGAAQSPHENPYIGTRTHLDDIGRLAAAAPPELTPSVGLYYDFIAAGGTATPDGQPIDPVNWPVEVRNAVDTIFNYSAEAC